MTCVVIEIKSGYILTNHPKVSVLETSAKTGRQPWWLSGRQWDHFLSQDEEAIGCWFFPTEGESRPHLETSVELGPLLGS